VEAPVREPLWTYDAGAPLWAGVTAGDGLVYAGSDNGILVALDAAIGEPVWTHPTRGPLRARPTLAEGWLLLHSDDGSLYALDPVTGEERWRTALLDSVRTRMAPGTPGSRYEHYASAPAAAGGRVFVGAADGAVHCLDLGSGDRHWVARTGDAVNMTPAVSGGRVFVGSFDGRVYAFEAETGRELWTHDTGAPVVSSPAVAGSLILIGSRSYDFLALDVETGETAWKRYFWFSWVESSAALGGSIAFVGSSDAQILWALEAASGRRLWKVDIGGSVWGNPCLSGTTVFVGTVGVADYMIDHQAGFMAVDRKEGAVRWRYPLARPTGAKLWGFASSPAVDTERVYVGGLDGRVRAFPQ
jgi:outer membrane protein assembly factor BamB